MSVIRTGMIIGLLLALIVGSVSAQDEEATEGAPTFVASPYGVYVTTQGNVSLRLGPGTAFERLTVVPAATTLAAVGRTPDTSWIQVEFEDQRGWMASRYLVWSGNVAALPVSAVDELPVVRLGILGRIGSNTRLFDNSFRPVAGVAVEAGTVEITGRLGQGRYIWLQVNYRGALYWVRSWEIDYDADYSRVIDIAYLFPYSRIVGGVRADISETSNRLASIEGIWTNIANGGAASCLARDQPRIALRRVPDADIRREPRFAPVIAALDAAVLDINATVSAFNQACARPSDQFFLTEDEVREALARLQDARRNLLLAQSLIVSLGVRDPLLGNTSGN